MLVDAALAGILIQYLYSPHLVHTKPTEATITAPKFTWPALPPAPLLLASTAANGSAGRLHIRAFSKDNHRKRADKSLEHMRQSDPSPRALIH